jgi:DNA-binding response OmpR family regulator
MATTEIGAAMTKHVLVFNDAQETLALLEGILRLDGFEVSTALFGTDELARIDAVNPDLIILDCIGEQISNGWVIIQQLRSRSETASLPVVLCLPAKKTEDAKAYLSTKRVVLVTKPYLISDLLISIREAFCLLNPPPSPNVELNA